MRCIAYLETKALTKLGKPFKNGKPKTEQVSTTLHTDPEKAKKLNWHRCVGYLTAHFNAQVEGQACDPFVDITISFTCNKCSIQTGIWALGEKIDDESFIEKVLLDYIESQP